MFVFFTNSYHILNPLAFPDDTFVDSRKAPEKLLQNMMTRK